MLLWSVLSVTIICASLSVLSTAQTINPDPTKPFDPRVFEDDEVQITIPPGWHGAFGNFPASVGNSVLQADGLLALRKGGYTLALAYRTQHASGIVGGRFGEAFNIPWLDPDQASSCSLVFLRNQQPATRALRFESMLMDTGSPNVRAECGIRKKLPGRLRWYGGYFTPHGGYFFDEPCTERCQSKLYTLTSDVKTPEQLPSANDPHLRQITKEAIGIVNSIYYKRRAPAPASLRR